MLQEIQVRGGVKKRPHPSGGGGGGSVWIFSGITQSDLLYYSTNLQGAYVLSSLEFTVKGSSSWTNYRSYHSVCEYMGVLLTSRECDYYCTMLNLCYV